MTGQAEVTAYRARLLCAVDTGLPPGSVLAWETSLGSWRQRTAGAPSVAASKVMFPGLALENERPGGKAVEDVGESTLGTRKEDGSLCTMFPGGQAAWWGRPTTREEAACCYLQLVGARRGLEDESVVGTQWARRGGSCRGR